MYTINGIDDHKRHNHEHDINDANRVTKNEINWISKTSISLFS